MSEEESIGADEIFPIVVVTGVFFCFIVGGFFVIRRLVKNCSEATKDYNDTITEPEPIHEEKRLSGDREVGLASADFFGSSTNDAAPTIVPVPSALPVSNADLLDGQFDPVVEDNDTVVV